MAMFPNAARGYMPFVTGQNGQKKHVTCCKKHGKPNKTDKKRKGTKTYQVTLKDRSGRTYRYIVRTDGTKSMPVLCDPKLASMGLGLGSTTSLPSVSHQDSIQRLLYSRDDLDVKNGSDKKEGLFSAFFRFLKEKTGKSKSGKSKRKLKPQVQRKRQRTISAMSNLDPIQESPDEYEYVDDDDDDEDNESYNHDSDPNSENSSICETESKQDESDSEEAKEEIKKVP